MKVQASIIILRAQRNGEVLLRVKDQRNILRQIRKQKANWIGHILHKNSITGY